MPGDIMSCSVLLDYEENAIQKIFLNHTNNNFLIIMLYFVMLCSVMP